MAAERGEAEGCYCLFVAYKNGKGVPVSNRLALKYLFAAAGQPGGEEGGSGSSSASASSCCGEAAQEGSSQEGEGGEDEDVGLVRVRASYILGSMYESGDLGCEVDLEKAVDWWTKAAEKSHPCSMVRIGVLQRKQGERAQAEKWFRLAASLGHSIPGEGEEHSH